MKLSEVTVPVTVDVDVNIHCKTDKDKDHKITPFQEAIIDRLDHIVDLLTEIHHIDRLLLRNERKELKMTHEVRDAIQELVATTTAQTTIEEGIKTAIEGSSIIMASAGARISELLQDLADNAGDAVAVREITAKLQAENEAMAASRDALVAANSALAAAVQTNTGSTGSSDTPPSEPAVEPPVSPETGPETPTTDTLG